MANSLKNWLRPLFFWGGLPQARIIYRRIVKQPRVFILMYHRIDFQSAPFFEVAVHPDVFEKQIKHLLRYFRIVDLKELCTLSAPETQKDVVVLTIDDGYRDNYTHAFPILKKYQVPATIFPATDYIGTGRLLWYDQLAWILYTGKAVTDEKTLSRHGLSDELSSAVDRFYSSKPDNRMSILRAAGARLKTVSPDIRDNLLHQLADVLGVKAWPGNENRAMLTWEEVKEMSANGIAFGCHTKSHPVLRSLSEQETRLEIVESKKMIEEQTQTKVSTFSYPYGKKDEYQSEYINTLLRDEGFVCCCSTNPGSETLPLMNPLELKRKGVAPYPYLFL